MVESFHSCYDKIQLFAHLVRVSHDKSFDGIKTNGKYDRNFCPGEVKVRIKVNYPTNYTI